MQRAGCVGASLLLLLVACTEAPQLPMRVGTLPWAGNEPLFLARELGLMPAGKVHLVEHLTISQTVRAFRNGALDAALWTLDEYLLLDHASQPSQVVLVLDASHGADCLVARPEVETLAALVGRRIAYEDSALGNYILHRIEEQAGLAPTSLRRVDIPLSGHEEAWLRGEVDAVVTFEPACTRLKDAGARVLFDSSNIPGEIVDVLAVRKDYLQAHPEQVDALVRGWFAALEHLRAHPEEDVRRMAPRLGLQPEQLRRALEGVRLADEDAQRVQLLGPRPLLLTSLERMKGVLMKQGLLQVPPEVSTLIDTAPLRRVLP
jgi:NitT/TauT family transport system substrate-binding protein